MLIKPINTKMQTNSITTTLIGLLISSVVLVSSLHAVQIIGDHKVGHQDVGMVKLSLDLHQHNDKSNTQIGDQVSVDGRSLKLHRKHKARDVERLQAWWRLHGLHLG